MTDAMSKPKVKPKIKIISLGSRKLGGGREKKKKGWGRQGEGRQGTQARSNLPQKISKSEKKI